MGKLKVWINSLFSTEYLPMSRFEDIDKPFYQRDSRILWLRKCFEDLKSYIVNNKNLIFVTERYRMWQRRRNFIRMTPE